VDGALRAIALDGGEREVFRAVLAERGRDGLDILLVDLVRHPLAEGALAVGRGARDHPDPAVRKAALAALFSHSLDRDRLALLKETWERDPDPEIRLQVLGIAGAFGDGPENLDLRAIIAAEADPEVLAAAIEARDAWAKADPGGTRWTPAEVARLRALARDGGSAAVRVAARAILARVPGPVEW